MENLIKSHQLRESLEKIGFLRLMGGHNGLSAKLAEEAGFDAIWASSFEISTAAAVPDASILTMTEYLQRFIEINDACNIPVIADCDTGYGNSSNVIRLVQKIEAEGIAVKMYFYPPIHQQPCYSHFHYKAQDYPNTTEIAENIICIPLFSAMKKAQQKQIMLAFEKISKHTKEIKLLSK